MTRKSDTEARSILEQAFALRGMPAVSLAELQTAQAIARFEGGYGDGWVGEGVGSHNWGAIQCGHYAPCEPGCFQNGDSHADGAKYQGCFRIYPDDLAGAGALLHQLYRRQGVPEAMAAGDATAVAEAMRATGYFEAPATRYATAIETHAGELSASLGEPHLVVRGGGRVGGPATPPPPLPPPVWPTTPQPTPTAADPTRSSASGVLIVASGLGVALATALLLRGRPA